MTHYNTHKGLLSIPQALRDERRWVLWRSEERGGQETKVPYQPSGEKASSTNPQTWVSFDDAVDALENGFTGVGFVLGDGWVGLDFDHCVQSDEAPPQVQEIIKALDGYAEISPSGNGVHIICRGKLPQGPRRFTAQWAKSIEVYDNGRYFTMTGRVLHHGDLASDKSEELKGVYAKLDLENFKAKCGDKARKLAAGDIEGYSSQSEADLALAGLLLKYTGGDRERADRLFRASKLFRPKWDKIHSGEGKTYGQMTMEKAAKSFMSAAQVPQREPQEPEPPSHEDFHLTDLGNAERFATMHKGKALYVKAWGWLVWDGKRWARDDTGTIDRLATETVKSIYADAAQRDDSQERKSIADWAKRSESRQRIEAMIELAKAFMPAVPEQFDKDPYVLNVLNGTLDLRTMELRKHNPEDYLTKLAPVAYDPEAKAPLWESFLNRIFAGNQRLIKFVQKAVGYALTGDTKEQCFFILWGTGANGKSTFVTTVQKFFGDYALQTPADTLLAKRTEYIPNDVARLQGARFVSAIESAEGRKLNEALIKQMTGGDKISARFLHHEWFDFTPEFKIFFATNHKPVIRGTDHAIWRRIRLIPFTVTIPEHEQDRELPQKLLTEAPGILNWALEGCRTWQKEGLGSIEEVKQATEQYRTEMDVLAGFIEECCVVAPNAQVTSKELYDAYVAWCSDNGEEPLGKRAFGCALRERGFLSLRVGHRRERGWQGIGLKEDFSEDPFTQESGTHVLERASPMDADTTADTYEENANNADLNSKNTQMRTHADADFQVFSRNFLYKEKNPESSVRMCPQNEDFADQKGPDDASGEMCPHPGSAAFLTQKTGHVSPSSDKSKSRRRCYACGGTEFVDGVCVKCHPLPPDDEEVPF